MPEVHFPCNTIPDEPTVARLLGLYPQRQDAKWMQRVRVPGGRLTATQWQTLAEIAQRYTPSAPLHLTTRQDIELHDLAAEDVPAVQRALVEADLTTVGACGDTFRNITICPCSGVFAGAADLFPLAQEVHRTLQREEGIFSLPRKFKISFSCCEACGQPWINDLGFVVRRKKGQYGFRVIGAGSLGRKPATGIVLFDWLSSADVLPVVIAAVRLFAAHGDREHRNRARLRHVRERVGDEKFMTMLPAELDKARADRTWPEMALAKPGGEFTARLALSFHNGDVTVAAANALAQLAGRDDIRVRIANHHSVILFGLRGEQLGESVSPLDSLAQAAKPQVTIVTCPGTRWCKRALCETNALADRIRSELPHKLDPQTTVCISGCPNNCAHSAVADIGLIGQPAVRDGQKAEAFNLLANGGMGRNDKLAELVAAKLSADEVLDKIRNM